MTSEATLNNIAFLTWLGKHLGFKEMEDWYNVTKMDFVKNGGSKLLDNYGQCSSIVRSIYPEYDWRLWRFERVPKGFWNEKKNQKEFMDWFGIQLGFKEMKDYYKITIKEVK